MGYELFWGETHANIHTRHLEAIDKILSTASSHLDFVAMAYYPYRYRDVRGFSYEDWIDEDQMDSEWKTICEATKRHNSPGRFVVFPGYEWQGDGTWGDHNVFHLYDDPPLARVDTLPELYSWIRDRGLEALAIPHHTAYMVGIRGKNWDLLDEELSPFVEIYSQHGCSESDSGPIGLRANRHMGPEVSGGTVEEGLERGYRLGIICSTDDHSGFPGRYGWGLMGCWAKNLTRESLWEAFEERRVYGVTGDRIRLEFSVEGSPMGSVVEKSGPVEIEVRAVGSDAIDRIELLRNNRLIACHHPNHAQHRGGGLWKLRIEAGWGPSTSELPQAGEQSWQGILEVKGGSIRSVEPCWREPGQWFERPEGGVCRFGFKTSPPTSAGWTTEGLVFEIEAGPTNRIEVTVDGKRREFTLEEAERSSAVIYFPEESARRIKKAFGVEVSTLPRPDPIYFLSRKLRIYRAARQSDYDVTWRYVDTRPKPGTNHYRVRVHQRNGHIAWSSPVWVINA